MFACIRHYGDRTFCGRSKEEKEWVFMDPGHAVMGYDAETNKIPLGAPMLPPMRRAGSGRLEEGSGGEGEVRRFRDSTSL
jgi:hypothetical protein